MSDTGNRQTGLTDLPRTFASVRARWQDIAAGSLTRKKLNNRHQFFEFRVTPTMMLKGTTGAAPSGATGSVNILGFAGEGMLEMQMLGAGQTIIVPVLKDDGLEISQDQADDEGVELCAGITSRAASAFQVGTDPAFFLRVRGVIDDVSGSDELAFGFRKTQAYQAALASYTDFAVVNLNAGQWESKTNLNNGGVTTTTLTGATVADLGAFEVMISVSSSGAVTYTVGTAGSRSSNSAAVAFTLDSNDVVVPFCRFLHTSDLANSVRLRHWEAGFAVNFEETA